MKIISNELSLSFIILSNIMREIKYKYRDTDFIKRLEINAYLESGIISNNNYRILVNDKYDKDSKMYIFNEFDLLLDSGEYNEEDDDFGYKISRFCFQAKIKYNKVDYQNMLNGFISNCILSNQPLKDYIKEIINLNSTNLQKNNLEKEKKYEESIDSYIDFYSSIYKRFKGKRRFSDEIIERRILSVANKFKGTDIFNYKMYDTYIGKKPITDNQRCNDYKYYYISENNKYYYINVDDFIKNYLKQNYKEIKEYYYKKIESYFSLINISYNLIVENYNKVSAIPKFTEVYNMLKKNNIDQKIINNKLIYLFDISDKEIYYYQKVKNLEETIKTNIDDNKKIINNYVEQTKRINYSDFVKHLSSYELDSEEQIICLNYLFLELLNNHTTNSNCVIDKYYIKEIVNLIIENSSDNSIYKIVKNKIKDNKKIKEKKEVDERKQKEINRILSGDVSREQNRNIFSNRLREINNGYDFESFISDLFSKFGYNSIVTKKSQDQGADILLENNGIKTVVQAKFYTGKVGNGAVQEVVAAKAYYDAVNAIVITNSTYTESAINLAKKNKVELIDGKKLLQLIDEL